MPEARKGPGPHHSCGTLTHVVALLILTFACGLLVHASPPRRHHTPFAPQEGRDAEGARTLGQGRTISRWITDRVTPHYYRVSLAENELVYIFIRQKEMLLKAEVFRPDGLPTELHTGGSADSTLAFSISARSAGSYLIKITRAVEPRPRRGQRGSYTIELTKMPRLEVNGPSVGGRTNNARRYNLNLRAREPVYIETTSGEDLNIVVVDSRGRKLPGNHGTHVNGKKVTSSLVLHARASGLHLVEVHSDRRPVDYMLKARSLPALSQDRMYGLVHGNHVYGLKLSAGQIFRAVYLGNTGLVAPHIYILDPEDKQKKPIVRHSQDRLSISFIAAVAGWYVVIVDNSNLAQSSSHRLVIEAVRPSTTQDKMEFAVQSCEGSPVPRKQGNLTDELRFFDTCFNALHFLVAGSYPEVARLAAGVSEDIDFMVSRWDQKPPAPSYRRSLDAIHSGLEDALHSPDRQKRFQLLSLIASDIAVKAEHCRKSKPGKGLGDPVKLIVTTVRDGEPVKGYRVFCVPTLEEFREPPSTLYSFDRLSDPQTEITLPPGKYKVWGEKSEEQRKKKKNDVVLGVGRDTMVTTIGVP